MSWRCIRILVLLFALAIAGCGDGVVIISTNLGIVAADASCQNNGGEFNLRNDQGLFVLVVLNSNSTIVLANGTAGTCTDLTAGAHASVRGAESNGQITARQVSLLN